jgi:dUTP pyrophosphatase
VKIRLRRLPHGRDLPLPSAASAGSAGLDLVAAVEGTRVLCPRDRMLVPTGLVMEIPPGFEGQIRPRSGLAWKHGVTVANPPGTIDSDYRGEVKVLLIHLGDESFTVARGDRVAQLVVARVERVEWEEAEELAETGRGEGGFGSTGG